MESRARMQAEIHDKKEFIEARRAVRSSARISTTRSDPSTAIVVLALSEGTDSVSGKRAL
jgi:hypothetical protein